VRPERSVTTCANPENCWPIHTAYFLLPTLHGCTRLCRGMTTPTTATYRPSAILGQEHSGQLSKTRSSERTIAETTMMMNMFMNTMSAVLPCV
jgi:hypothetical protein